MSELGRAKAPTGWSAQLKPYSLIADGLSALRRIVEADIAATAWPSPTAKGNATSRDTENHDSAPLKPDEAALLATLTNKFYASPAFKGLLAAIVCAVGLAAIGTVVIGTESYDLLKRVRDVGDAGEKTITAAVDTGRKSVDDQVKAAKEALGRQNDATARLKDDVQAKAERFSKEVDRAEAQIQQQREDFKRSLQADMLAQVIAGVKAQIEGPISETRTEIEKFRRDKFATLQTTIGALDTSAGKVDQQLQQIRAKIDPLTQLTDSVAPLANRVKEIRAAADSAAQARADESAAKAAQLGAEAAKEAITIQVHGLAEELPRAQKQLDDVKARLAALSKQIDELSPPTSDIQLRLAALEGWVKTSQSRTPREDEQYCKTPLSEENLSFEQRQDVQRRIAALGFAPRRVTFEIDGKFGDNTRGAIRRWQASFGENTQDGRLTSAEIARLLGPLAACAEWTVTTPPVYAP